MPLPRQLDFVDHEKKHVIMRIDHPSCMSGIEIAHARAANP